MSTTHSSQKRSNFDDIEADDFPEVGNVEDPGAGIESKELPTASTPAVASGVNPNYGRRRLYKKTKVSLAQQLSPHLPNPHMVISNMADNTTVAHNTLPLQPSPPIDAVAIPSKHMAAYVSRADWTAHSNYVKLLQGAGQCTTNILQANNSIKRTILDKATRITHKNKSIYVVTGRNAKRHKPSQ